MSHPEHALEVEMGDFIGLRFGLLHALDGDHIAAIVWTHIRFRQQLTDREYHATTAELLDELVMGKDKFRRAVNRLRDDGWLVWGRASFTDATNIYTALIPGLEEPPRPQKPKRESPKPRETRQSENVESDRRETGGIAWRETGDIHGGKPANLSTPKHCKQGTEETPLPPNDTTDRSAAEPRDIGLRAVPTTPRQDDFERFWELAVRKTGKGAARKAFTNAASRTPVTVIGPAWVAANQAWATWPDRTRIPHPATWLNQERWDDETPEPVGAAVGKVQATYDLLAQMTPEAEQRIRDQMNGIVDDKRQIGA